MKKNVLFQIPPGSDPGEVTLLRAQGQVVLDFDFRSDGKVRRGGFRFTRARALQSRAESHSTVWQIDGVYNTLAEVEDSEWVRELLANTQSQWPFPVRHFMIYIEDAGSFEVAAEEWEWFEGTDVQQVQSNYGGLLPGTGAVSPSGTAGITSE